MDASGVLTDPRRLSGGILSASTISSRSSGVVSEKLETSTTKLVKSPLDGILQEDLLLAAKRFAEEHGLAEYKEVIMKGALVAQDPAAFESLSELSEDEKILLRREVTHKWDQPWELYYMVILCSLAAAVQGVRSAIYPRLMAGN